MGRVEPDAFARELLRRAVETPSPSGQEREIVGRLADMVDPKVDRVDIDAVGNLVVEHGRGTRVVTFLGHVDTVPGVVPVAWRDGALFGRGSVDAKGSLTAALAATVALPDEARELLTVRVVGAVGEEAPGSVGATHVAATLPPPDFLIVCEPSGWDAMTMGYKGHVRLRVSVSRASGHSAGPHASAGDVLVETVTRLGRLCADLTPREAGPFDAVQCTVLGLDVDHDGLRERATADIGLRTPIAWPGSRLVGYLRGALEIDEIDEVDIDASDMVDAVRAARDGELPRSFRTAIRASGGRPRTVVKTGTSDWNVVAPSWPVPTIAYGPGDASLDHTPNEHLDLASFDAAVEVLESVLGRLAANAVRDQTGRSSSE